jgi:uncharacterized integral membrane protein
MFKIIATIISTAVAVLFAVQNFEHVPVYIFWGKAVNIRLIFVIAIAVACGYLLRLFIGIGREERMKRQVQTLLRRHSSMKQRINEFDEEL